MTSVLSLVVALMTLVLSLTFVSLASAAVINDEPSPLNVYRPPRDGSTQRSSDIISPLPIPSNTEAYALRIRNIGAVPLKGWNSYDSTGGAGDEGYTKLHIDYISSVLLPLGYTIVTIDAGWYGSERDEIAIDEFGRPQPSPMLFPSATNLTGFSALSDYAHQKGLLFGIHIMRGVHNTSITRRSRILGTNTTVDQIVLPNSKCGWWQQWNALDMSKPEAQIFYDSLFQQYAAWKIDFIKADCMFARDFAVDNIVGMSNAITKSGRDMLFSLSPGPYVTLEQSNAVKRITNMYRISDDYWDEWPHLMERFQQNSVQQYVNIAYPNGRYNIPSFPDLDMLCLGIIREPGESKERMTSFTKDEAITTMTYWAIWRSPLIIGSDLTKPDTFTMSLYTNTDMLEVVDHSKNNAPVVYSDQMAIWRADHQDESGVSWVTVHNWLRDTVTIHVNIAAVRSPQPGNICLAKEVWSGQMFNRVANLDVILGAHASAFFKLSNCTISGSSNDVLKELDADIVSFTR